MQGRTLFFIKLSIAIFFAVFLVAYFLYQSRFFLLGSKIEVFFPENGQTLSDSFAPVKGVVTGADTLMLNDRVIIVDAFGSFEEGLLLAQGYNIIELTAVDKFGRVVNKKIEVVLKN